MTAESTVQNSSVSEMTSGIPSEPIVWAGEGRPQAGWEEEARQAEAECTEPERDPGLCQKCGARLTRDDIGLHKKLVNRGAVTFFCKTCLAKEFHITEEACDMMIERLRKNGCSLFC